MDRLPWPALPDRYPHWRTVHTTSPAGPPTALPTLQLVWADAGYAGKLVTWAQQVLTLAVQIVRKRQGVHHFEVLPRRWVVERTFSWLGKCRRLAVDYERKPEHHQAWVQWAMVRVMVKRLARQAPPQPTRTLSLAA